MGLLSEGTPLTWEETKKYADHVRKHGIEQFIRQYKVLKYRHGDCLKWGDEVEYMIIKLDHVERKARLSLRASELLEVLRKEEESNPQEVRSLWRPEYAEYMVEGTPGQPYGSLVQHFNIVEANMSFRRDEIQRLLGKDEIILTLTSFPRLGCKDFTWPYTKADPTKGPGRSLFFPEEAITQMHPRFKTLTRNIRERRGEKVAINIPIYKDTKTVQPFVEDFLPYGDDGSEAVAALSDHIYMDAMGFGMGCSCLQMTFQACNIDEARKLYDHLVPLCPIFTRTTHLSSVLRKSSPCLSRNNELLDYYYSPSFLLPPCVYCVPKT